MKKVITSLLLLNSVGYAHAWDFSLKADAQKSYTDNVNLTKDSPIKDDYTVLSGYLQAKEDEFKLKLKGKVEKYSKQKENDSYSTDLSLQYKPSKTNDFTVGIFQQIYNGTPTVTTDTTSDNKGIRVAANYNYIFTENLTTGYIGFTGSLKNYTKIAGRKDKLFGLSLGLEQNLTKEFLLIPEVSFQVNSSADSYYSNNSYGPNLLLSYTPDDSWEWFSDASYTRTNYSGRTVTSTVGKRTVTNKEYQELVSMDAGVIYSFPQYISLTGKYTHSKNSSNNSSSDYKADVYFVGIGLKL